MAITGLGTALGMLVLGVPFPLPLGLLAFLTEAIPMVGPYIAGVPIVLIAFSESPITGVLMAAWIFGLQQLEGYVLAPSILRHAVDLSPVIILLAIVAGGTLAGVLGALIAVPLVAALQVLVREVVLPLRRASWEQ